MTASRLDRRFAQLKTENRAGLVTFITAGDPDLETGLEILKALPDAGADIIELGMPFSDPMADGPAIQAASLRALRAGGSLQRTLDMVADFRKRDTDTPIVLMGYYNPIYSYGVKKFLDAALGAGVDGLIVVDLPPEEDEELCLPALQAGISFIRLVAPTTDDRRLPVVLENTSGFVYYISIKGTTGAASAESGSISAAVERLRRHTQLPIAVGFGIRTPEQAAEVARLGDAVVVGSALVQTIEQAGAGAGAVSSATGLVRALASAIRQAR